MKEKKKKQSITLELTEFESDSGEVITIQEEELSKLLNWAIEDKERSMKKKCEQMDRVYHFNQLDGKSPREIASTIFFGQFFIEYQGNPSMNGGNFYYDSYEPSNNKEHLYFDSDPLSGEGYQYRILSGLACNNYFRWFGYGVQQAAYKFWQEDEFTAKKFVDYIKNESLIPLSTKTIGYSSGIRRELEELDQTVGAGLFWYCLRSGYFEGAEEFRSHVDQDFLNKRALKTLLDLNDYKDSRYEENFDQNEKWKPSLLNKVNVIKSIIGGVEFPEDKDGYGKEMLQEIADSWMNKRMDIVDGKTLKLK